MLLEEFLKKIYDIPLDATLLTVIDFVPVYINFNEYQTNLKHFAYQLSKNITELNSTEQIIIENES
jgi:hypothetical protein